MATKKVVSPRTKKVLLDVIDKSIRNPVVQANFIESRGEWCKLHGTINRYVDATSLKRCMHCDRINEQKLVEMMERDVRNQHEAEEAKAKASRFSFVSADKLSEMTGAPVLAHDTYVIQKWEEQRVKYLEKHTKSPCAEPPRWKLPDERKSYCHHFEIGDENKGGVSAYIHFGIYEDFRLGEVFIRAAKMGGYISGFTDGFATALSISLQHGIPLKVMADKFRHQSFDPSGFVKGSPEEIHTCSSVLDYVVNYLTLRFPDGYLEMSRRGLDKVD